MISSRAAFVPFTDALISDLDDDFGPTFGDNRTRDALNFENESENPAHQIAMLLLPLGAGPTIAALCNLSRMLSALCVSLMRVSYSITRSKARPGSLCPERPLRFHGRPQK